MKPDTKNLDWKRYFLSDKKAIEAARTLAKEHMKKYYKAQYFVYVLGIDGVDMRGGKYRDFEDGLNQIKYTLFQHRTRKTLTMLKFLCGRVFLNGLVDEDNSTLSNHIVEQ